eukprot:9578714-Ditylum_brightwellii.AAC.1
MRQTITLSHITPRKEHMMMMTMTHHIYWMTMTVFIQDIAGVSEYNKNDDELPEYNKNDNDSTGMDKNTTGVSNDKNESNEDEESEHE